jgi:transcriptional regulator with PAS, ATPase and Fis domain
MVKLIERVAPSGTNVLILGESGTGKELVARALHELSAVASGPFIAVNCGAIPETLIESELFGHKKGSFTGAVADKPGLFEAADGGTLFLDEIGELPLSMQVKLLRALQDRTVRRVGENRDVKVTARIVAATNRDLEEGVRRGTFREDLYFRLNVIQIETPPLRIRGTDIEVLAQIFLDRMSSKLKRKFSGFSPEALSVLRTHRWPGNIRELENVVERAATLETEEWITPLTFPAELVKAAAQSGKVVGALTLKADFSLGPVDLNAVLKNVQAFYEREALIVTLGDAEKAKLLLKE